MARRAEPRADAEARFPGDDDDARALHDGVGLRALPRRFSTNTSAATASSSCGSGLASRVMRCTCGSGCGSSVSTSGWGSSDSLAGRVVAGLPGLRRGGVTGGASPAAFSSL